MDHLENKDATEEDVKVGVTVTTHEEAERLEHSGGTGGAYRTGCQVLTIITAVLASAGPARGALGA